MKKLICLILIIVFTLFTISACSRENSNSDSDKEVIESENTQAQNKRTINGMLASFTAETLDGETFTANSFADNDITVINFWGTYCPPCIAEMPDLAEFKNNLPDNIDLITYCIDGSQNPDDARSIIDDADLDAVVITNADGDFESILSQIQYIPTTLFIDSNGNIVGSEIIGGVSSVKDVYNEHIEAALEETGIKQ